MPNCFRSIFRASDYHSIALDCPTSADGISLISFGSTRQPVQSPFTNLTSNSLTSRGRSCCTQWPHPLSTCEPRNPGSVLLKLAIATPPSFSPPTNSGAKLWCRISREDRNRGDVLANAFFLANDGTKGHRRGSRQRESSLNQPLADGSAHLRS